MEKLVEDYSKQTELSTNEPVKGLPIKIAEDSFNPNEILEPMLSARKVYVNEHWDFPSTNIQSRIVDVTKDTVVCDCLIDQENNIFETRQYPRILFENLKELKKNSYALISIKIKAGSSRIDVYEGNNLVDKKIFKVSDEWAQDDFSDLNTPLDAPIKL